MILGRDGSRVVKPRLRKQFGMMQKPDTNPRHQPLAHHRAIWSIIHPSYSFETKVLRRQKTYHFVMFSSKYGGLAIT